MRENLGVNGELDTDKFGRAMLAYRNTPCKDLGQSPDQILYGRCLRDHLPSIKEYLQQRKEWLLLKDDREKVLSAKYGRIQEDLSRHTKSLTPLPLGSVVQVQNQKGKDPLRWDKSGIVVESLGNQQYSVKMDGSGRVTLRNRKFLRKIEPYLSRAVSLDPSPQITQPIINSQTEEDISKTVGQQEVTPDTMDNISLRRSTRVRREPDRYVASLMS